MKNWVLIGLMGSGKSAVGRALAQGLGCRFLDTDSLIEKRVGLTVPEIFSRHGEGWFRAQEALVAEEVGNESGCVIATGGGMVIHPANMEALHRNGHLIFLTARPEVILERVKRRPKSRPLLNEGGDLLLKIQQLLKERESYYRQAVIHCDTSDRSVSEIAREIYKRVSEIEGNKWHPQRAS